MNAIRLIAVLLYKYGKIYQSVNFNHPTQIGNLITKIEHFNSWSVDEIVLLNVQREKNEIQDFYKIISKISERTFVPLTVGGWIENTYDAENILKSGADKIIINTQAFLNNYFVMDLVNKFGSQFVVISIDTRKINDEYFVVIDRGTKITDVKAIDWAVKVERLKVGEIFLNSIEHDGSRKGYDLHLMKLINNSVKIPVIGFGGVWEWQHLYDAITKANLEALAIGNVLHFKEHSVYLAKKFLLEKNVNVRKPEFFNYNKVRYAEYSDVL